MPPRRRIPCPSGGRKTIADRATPAEEACERACDALPSAPARGADAGPVAAYAYRAPFHEVRGRGGLVAPRGSASRGAYQRIVEPFVRSGIRRVFSRGRLRADGLRPRTAHLVDRTRPPPRACQPPEAPAPGALQPVVAQGRSFVEQGGDAGGHGTALRDHDRSDGFGHAARGQGPAAAAARSGYEKLLDRTAAAGPAARVDEESILIECTRTIKLCAPLRLS